MNQMLTSEQKILSHNQRNERWRYLIQKNLCFLLRRWQNNFKMPIPFVVTDSFFAYSKTWMWDYIQLWCLQFWRNNLNPLLQTFRRSQPHVSGTFFFAWKGKKKLPLDRILLSVFMKGQNRCMPRMRSRRDFWCFPYEMERWWSECHQRMIESFLAIWATSRTTTTERLNWLLKLIIAIILAFPSSLSIPCK